MFITVVEFMVSYTEKFSEILDFWNLIQQPLWYWSRKCVSYLNSTILIIVIVVLNAKERIFGQYPDHLFDFVSQGNKVSSLVSSFYFWVLMDQALNGPMQITWSK